MSTKSVTGRKNAGAAVDVLGQIAALVPTKEKPKSGKPSTWEMTLTPEAAVDAKRWIAAKTVLEPIKKRVENAKNDFCTYALRFMSERLFANKSKPSNPLVLLKKADGKTVDHQFQFQMTDRFKYRFPKVPEGVDSRTHFVEVFTNIGLHPVDAEKLVDNELDFNPITGLKSLTELMEGRLGEGREWIEASAESKIAGHKLAALLMWQGQEPAPEPLTLEEKAMVVERNPSIAVKAGFYDRVATYCQSVDQLMAVFTIIQPVVYPDYPKFAMNDTETDRTTRKIEAAGDILGSFVASE